MYYTDKDFKIVILGDSGVGKSSIINRFVRDRFSLEIEATVGAQFTKISHLIDCNEIRMNIWDTAGQERFKALTKMYYREADVILLVYDTTNHESFESLKNWILEIEKFGTKNYVLFIVANKEDEDLKRAVSIDEARDFAESIKASIEFTSAKSNSGIYELFREIVRSVSKTSKTSAEESVFLSRDMKAKAKKCKC